MTSLRHWCISVAMRNFLCLVKNTQNSGDKILNIDDCNCFTIYLKCCAVTDLGPN